MVIKLNELKYLQKKIDVDIRNILKVLIKAIPTPVRSTLIKKSLSILFYCLLFYLENEYDSRHKERILDARSPAMPPGLSV